MIKTKFKQFVIFACALVILLVGSVVPAFAGVTSSNHEFEAFNVPNSVLSSFDENVTLTTSNGYKGKHDFFILYNNLTGDYAVITVNTYGNCTFTEHSDYFTLSYDGTLIIAENPSSVSMSNYSENGVMSADSTFSAVPGNSINIGAGQKYTSIVYYGYVTDQKYNRFSSAALNTSISDFFIQHPQSSLKAVVTEENLGGVLLEILGLLPVLIPLIVTYISLRKGLRFTLAILRTA